MRLMRVVLPAPFGPIMARISPLLTSKLISLNARTPPKAFETLAIVNSVRPSVLWVIPLHLHGEAQGLPPAGIAASAGHDAACWHRGHEESCSTSSSRPQDWYWLGGTASG